MIWYSNRNAVVDALSSEVLRYIVGMLKFTWEQPNLSDSGFDGKICENLHDSIKAGDANYKKKISINDHVRQKLCSRYD